MTNKIGLTLCTAGMIAATALFVTYAPSIAQAKPTITTDFSAQQNQERNKKAAPAAGAAQPRVAPQRAAPQRAAPQRAAPQRVAPQRAISQRTAPQLVAPQRTTPRIATPRQTAPRMATQPKVTPRVARQPKTTPKFVAPTRTGRKVGLPTAAPRVVTPHGTRAVTASRLRGVPVRGAGRTVIRGQNYSAWRSGYRVRHGSNWRTFVALGALGAIAIGARHYYPYAYISAPGPYCEGLTVDGCELVWQQVETIEGDVIDQCVAYCPWQ